MKENPNIVELYIYCQKEDREISEALNFKTHSRKIKGIFFHLDKILERAEEELMNEIKLFQSKKGLSKRKYINRFPSFLKLSGEDKTSATLYRSNLYGSKNLPE